MTNVIFHNNSDHYPSNPIVFTRVPEREEDEEVTSAGHIHRSAEPHECEGGRYRWKSNFWKSHPNDCVYGPSDNDDQHDHAERLEHLSHSVFLGAYKNALHHMYSVHKLKRLGKRKRRSIENLIFSKGFRGIRTFDYILDVILAAVLSENPLKTCPTRRAASNDRLAAARRGRG